MVRFLVVQFMHILLLENGFGLTVCLKLHLTQLDMTGVIELASNYTLVVMSSSDELIGFLGVYHGFPKDVFFG